LLPDVNRVFRFQKKGRGKGRRTTRRGGKKRNRAGLFCRLKKGEGHKKKKGRGNKRRIPRRRNCANSTQLLHAIMVERGDGKRKEKTGKRGGVFDYIADYLPAPGGGGKEPLGKERTIMSLMISSGFHPRGEMKGGGRPRRKKD